MLGMHVASLCHCANVFLLLKMFLGGGSKAGWFWWRRRSKAKVVLELVNMQQPIPEPNNPQPGATMLQETHARILLDSEHRVGVSSESMPLYPPHNDGILHLQNLFSLSKSSYIEA